MMHMTLPVPDPRQIAPERNIPQPLIDVVFRALEKDANHRYQDALEFADALREGLYLSESVPPESRVSKVPAVPAGTTTVTCAACGSLVPLTKFCGECGSRLPVHSASPALPQVPTLPLELSEREEDLDWLRDRLDAVGDGVIGARIVGELGMGKTRLLEEFARSADELGNTVIRALPDPYYAEAAYYTLRETIRELAGLKPDDIAAKRFPGAEAEAVRGLIEVFAGSPPRDDVRKPVERRYAVAMALRWALQQAALDSGTGRVVVLIDDMSRVDTSSRRAFADVLGERDCPALLVAGHMPGLDLGWSSDHAAARVLSGLSPATAKRLLKDSAPSDLEALDEGRGILPMYVEQLVRYSLEGGTDAPRRLGDLIALRYDTIEPNARRLLQALVVLGDRVDTRLLAQFAPKAGDMASTLETLVQAGMVARHDDKVSTAHPLLRDVILGGIPVLVRKELHTKALALSDKIGAPLEARAFHAYYAEDSFQALLFLEQAATRAAARDDTEAEVLSLRRGLELARQEISRGELDDPLHAMLIFAKKLGLALTRAGNFADAEGVLREALDLAGPGGSERAQVLAALAQVAHSRHRATDAIGYIDAAIEAARRSGSHELLTSLSDTRRAWAS
jgi:serine/threonine-protein kinase